MPNTKYIEYDPVDIDIDNPVSNGIEKNSINFIDDYTEEGLTEVEKLYLEMYNIPITIFIPYDNRSITIDDFTNVKIIDEAFKCSRKGKLKQQFGALHYYFYNQELLTQLRKSIEELKFTIDAYRPLVIKDTKVRYIKVPTYKDKLLQYIVNLVLREYYEPRFIKTSYACIRERGNHNAVKRIQYDIKTSLREYKEPYFIKLDISKFFYNIDKYILMNILAKDIRCPKALHILRILIFSESNPWNKGLPLGNLTSQQFANIYMNELDQYVVKVLNIKHYVRYADDMFIIVEGQEYAKYIALHISNWVWDNLRLSINPIKTRIHKVKEDIGIIGLGFHIYKNYIYPLNKNRRKFIEYTKKRQIDSMQSWYGYASISKCYTFIQNTLKMYAPDIIFKNNKFILLKKENDV